MHHIIKSYLLFVLVACAITTHAQQPSYTLQTNESGSNKSYVARDNVSLKTGFSYSAVSGQSFSAKIDPGLLFPPTENTYADANGNIVTDPLEGASVGSLPGQFSVSPTGAATYTIPIEVPAGINGMQPNVSIIYNSQLPVGLLGKGFDLACSSTIYRIPHSLYYDNDTHSISFDGNDRFALDGMRLICDNITTYGNDQTIYFTENDQTTRITSYGSLGDGPLYFIMETPDGKTLEYGNTEDSRLILTNETGVYNWYLKKVTDNNGNSIIYNYTKFNAGIVLTSIQYAGGRIEFSYNFSTTNNNYFVNGNEVKNGFILERIRVKGINDYLRNYEFNGINKNGQVLLSEIKEYYNKNGRNLNEIDSGEEDYMFKKPIKFYWTNFSNSSFNNQMISESNENFHFYLDFNGDGYDDIYMFNKTGTTNHGHNKYEQRILKNVGYGTTVMYSEETNEDIIVLPQTTNAISNFIDINGDKKTDLVYEKSVATVSEIDNSLVYTYKIKVKYQSGDTYNSGDTLLVSIPNEMDDGANAVKTIFGDFDGDDKTEIIAICHDNSCFLINYVGGQLVLSPVNNNMDLYNVSEFLQGDFDGDGNVDFGFNINNTFKTFKLAENSIAEIYTFNSTVKYIADFNNDGVSDIFNFSVGTGNYDYVLQGNISTVNYIIYFRQKNNTFTTVTGELLRGNVFSNYVFQDFHTFTGSANDLTTTEVIVVKDVKFEDSDGDGFLNIILLYDRQFNFEKQTYHGDYDSPSDDFTSETQLVISSFLDNEDFFLLNSDRTFVNPNRNLTHHSYWINTSGNIAIGTYAGNSFKMIETDYYSSMNLGDTESRFKYTKLNSANINGNGNRNYYKSGTYEDVLGHFNSMGEQVYVNSMSDRYQIGSIGDSYGNITTISYKIPEKDFDNETSLVYPYFRYKTGKPVVESVTGSSVTCHYNRISRYTYSNEVFHIYKGFLGYLNTSVTNPDGITHSSTGVLNSNFGIIVPYSESSITKTVTSDMSVIDKLNKRYWMKTDKITEINYLNTTDYLKTTKTFESYDTNGNPTIIKTEYGDNTGVNSTETITYDDSPKGCWLANKPKTYCIVSKSPDVPDITRTKEFTYYDNGNLKSEITDKNNADNLQLSKEYEYDTYGNPTKVTLTAKNIDTGSPIVRTSVMTYPSGRFLETLTDHLGRVNTYHWNSENGLLQSEDMQSSVNDQTKKTITYKYDVWGQLLETAYPDGVRKTQVVQWAEPDNANYAKYFVYTQTSGCAPVKVWYDALGREVLNETFGFNNRKISRFTEYNLDGRMKRISEPTYNSSAEAWAQYDFVYNTDPFKRVTSYKTSQGTISNTYGKTSITTLTVNTSEGVKTSSKETTIDDTGRKISVKVDGKEVTYAYNASGLIKSASPVDGQELTMLYDIQGNRTFFNDPDAGVIESTYNGFGELIKSKQKVHNATNTILTSYTYKPNGMLDFITRNDETTNYTYDAKNRLTKIEVSTTNKQEFIYDEFDRIILTKETVGTKSFEHKTEYDILGRVKKNIFPTGYYTQNKYDQFGNLTQVEDRDGRSIWKLIDENARGQITNIEKGSKATSFGFNSVTGLPVSTFANGIINYSYVYNELGNLMERTDHNKNQKESFAYNSQSQLTEWNVYYNNSNTYEYNFNIYNDAGNIFKKSDIKSSSGDVVEMTYGISGTTGTIKMPHALTKMNKMPANFPSDALAVTYTDFKKVATIHEGIKDYELTYGVDNQRRKSVYKENGVHKLTKYYLGDYEEEINGTNIRKIHYLSGAILIQNNGVDSLLYTYSDAQGSLIALTDVNGNVLTKTVNGTVVEVGRFAYDPWGKRRDPNNWSLSDSRTSWVISRGYTGHEHLDMFSVINMNGRAYDPLTAQFFSPDPYIQSPDNWLNYNRYAYCLNNPFKYSDPSGNDIKSFFPGFINFLYNYWLYNTDSGFEWQKRTRPYAVQYVNGIGSDVQNYGYIVSVGDPKNNITGYRQHYGEVWCKSYYDNSFSGKMYMVGGERFWSAQIHNNYGCLSVSGTRFDSGDISQTATQYTFGGSFFNVKYENDKHDLDIGGVPTSDSDGYRTAAVQFNFGPFHAGMNLFTGMPGSNDVKENDSNQQDLYGDGSGHPTYIQNSTGNPDKYRAGVFYIGIGNWRAGINSEFGRAAVQNTIHFLDGRRGDGSYRSPYFKYIEGITPTFYWYNGGTFGNTLW